MKKLACWAIASGLVLAALVLTLPVIAEHSYSARLSHIGAEHLAASMAQKDISDRQAGILGTVCLAVMCVVAGLLMLSRRHAGWLLWIAACVLFVAYSATELFLSGAMLAPILRAAWWASVLVVSLRLYKRTVAQWFGFHDQART